MQTKDEGGPAFPTEITTTHILGTMTGESVEKTLGMSLRDYFAGQSLVGFLACPNSVNIRKTDSDKVAEDCYYMADAMLTARKR